MQSNRKVIIKTPYNIINIADKNNALKIKISFVSKQFVLLKIETKYIT
jgi:hypothetical protein